MNCSFIKDKINSTFSKNVIKVPSLIRVLKCIPDFKKAFESHAGPWDNYSLEEHTVHVLSHFEMYCSKVIFGRGQNRLWFRLLLALHDIGKPMAIENGDKDRQHVCSRMIINQNKHFLPLTTESLEVMESILFGDPLGDFLKMNKTLSETKNIILNSAKNTKWSVKEFFECLLLYYQMDAGSYTHEICQKKALDELFKYDQKTNKKVWDARRERLVFSCDLDKQIQMLERELGLI